MAFEECKQKLFKQRPDVKEQYDRLIEKDKSKSKGAKLLDDIQKNIRIETLESM